MWLARLKRAGSAPLQPVCLIVQPGRGSIARFWQPEEFRSSFDGCIGSETSFGVANSSHLRVSTLVLGCERSKSGFAACIIAPKLVCLPLKVDIAAPKLVCLPTELRRLHRNSFVCQQVSPACHAHLGCRGTCGRVRCFAPSNLLVTVAYARKNRSTPSIVSSIPSLGTPAACASWADALRAP